MSNRPVHPIPSYSEFWLYYLQEHAKPVTRRWHLAGTLTALGLVAAAVATLNPWFLPAALFAGYGPAFASHYLYEKNRPATFRYPLWSFIADLHMTASWVTGRLSRELTRAGV